MARERKEVLADIKRAKERNDRGYVQDCVYATCQKSGITVGPIWGTSDKSVRFALRELSQQCTCEDVWHKASGGEDSDPNQEVERPSTPQRGMASQEDPFQ